MVLFYIVWVVCMKSMAGIAKTTREYGDVPQGATLKRIAPWGTSRQPEFAARSCHALIATHAKWKRTMQNNILIMDKTAGHVNLGACRELPFSYM
jgi:hypothetical protein